MNYDKQEFSDAEQKRLDEIDAAEKLLIEDSIDSFAELVTSGKIANKLIEKSINFNIDKLAFETDLKGNIIKVNGFCRGDVISAFIDYVDINMSYDEADRIISTLFKTED